MSKPTHIDGECSELIFWFTAGVLGAIDRRLEEDARPDDYFMDFVKSLVANDDDMEAFLELFHAKYHLLTTVEKQKFTGPYVGQRILAPVDLPQRMQTIANLIEYETDDRVRELTTGAGKVFEIRGDGKMVASSPKRARDEKGPSVASKRKPKEEEKAEEGEEGPTRIWYDGNYEDLTKCCEELGIRLLSIQVVKETDWEPGADDVYVRGAMTAGPSVKHGRSPYHWPLDSDKEPTTRPLSQSTTAASSTAANTSTANINETIIAAAPAVNDCWAKFGAMLTFWEGDWNDFGKSLRTTIQQYQSAAAVALMTLDPLAAPSVGPLTRFAENLLDLLGLSDEPMGGFGVAVHAPVSFHPKRMREYTWAPSLAALTAQHTGIKISEEKDTFITFEVDLTGHGGHWKAWIQVYRVCVNA